jgi:hypothetical protein
MTDSDIKIKGKKPIASDLEWISYGRQILKESPQVLDENAKSMVALGSSLLAVYTGALALLNFNEKFDLKSEERIFLLLPIIIWLISISFNAYVYFPRRYAFAENMPNEIKKAQKEISRTKHFRLKIGAIFFIAALGLSSFCILWLGNQDPLQNSQVRVQFVTSNESIPILEDMSVSFEKDTQRTVPILLLEKTDKTYLVQINDSRKVEFERDLIQGVIYLSSKKNIMKIKRL